jgi:hypothetical protein
MPGKLSDNQYQQVLRDIRKRQDRQREADLRSMMAQEWGRRLCHWLVFDLGKLQTSSFNPSIKDGYCAALHSARSEGARDFAIELHNEVQRLAPQQFLTMMSEQVRDLQADLALEDRAAKAAEEIA